MEEGVNSMKNQISELENNFCLGGKNSESLKENLINFAKGPCSPVMLTPGILSTKLMVEIDCETLKASHPEVFKSCGWTKCEKNYWDIFDKVPLKEYILWISPLTSPLSIVEWVKSHFCFTGIFAPNYDLSKPNEKILRTKKGLKITPFGFSKETKGKGKCGLDAV